MWFCLACKTEREPNDGLPRCPHCDSQWTPIDLEDKVAVEIPFEMLKKLCQ